jgi:hypothetical protein
VHLDIVVTSYVIYLDIFLRPVLHCILRHCDQVFILCLYIAMTCIAFGQYGEYLHSESWHYSGTIYTLCLRHGGQSLHFDDLLHITFGNMASSYVVCLDILVRPVIYSVLLWWPVIYTVCLHYGHLYIVSWQYDDQLYSVLTLWWDQV